MKTRIGFVSNSSSSSFIIGHNEEDIEKLFEKIFDIEVHTPHFSNKEAWYTLVFPIIGKQLSNEIRYDGHIDTFSSYQSWFDDFKNDCYCEPDEDEVKQYTELFKKWKYVTELSIPGGGDGGTSLTHIFRDYFPVMECENFKIIRDGSY